MDTPRYRGGDGWMVAIGFAFAGVAAVVYRVAGTRDFNAPAYVGWAIAALFGLAGLVLVTRGLGGMWRAARRRRWRLERPGEPWHADHDWDPWGERDRPWARVGHMGAGLLWVGLFGVVAHGVGFGAGAWPFLAGALLLDVIFLALLFGALRRVARALRFGAGYVRFERFPYAPGDPLRIRIGLPADLDAIDATLRYVEESFDDTRDGRRLRREVVYEDTQRVERPGREPRVAFGLPADAPSTALGAEPPRYWELVVISRRAGLDYRAVFLVPVYATTTSPAPQPSA